MAYPIRFKLIDKKTGQEVKGHKKTGTGFNENPISALIFPSGQPAIMEQDFYTYVNKVSCADYELWVALEKDPEGNWIYKKIGD